jgi:pantoate--beta-alanine ligase
MIIARTILETKNYLKSHCTKTIGFVPTMGALHNGHIELVKRAVNENEISVCSVFVNPTQFNNPDDLKKYPRTLEADLLLLEAAGCDLVFAPSAEEMYGQNPILKLDFGDLEHIMEGEFRPGHFNGVGIVVSKLFHIVNPTKAYFGQKDIQQVAVINRLINDLSFDLEMVVCETIRENDGLAMSSRNRRLSDDARKLAPKIYESLLLGKKLLKEGSTPELAFSKIKEYYDNIEEIELEYYKITSAESLAELSNFDPKNKTALILAAYLDGVRLIDNLIF